MTIIEKRNNAQIIGKINLPRTSIKTEDLSKDGLSNILRGLNIVHIEMENVIVFATKNKLFGFHYDKDGDVSKLQVIPTRVRFIMKKLKILGIANGSNAAEVYEDSSAIFVTGAVGPFV